MIVRLVPRAQTEAAWRSWDADMARARHASDRPAVVMADEAATLLDQRERVFRGRRYSVPPIPWALAVRLLACQEEMRRIAGRPDASATETVAVFARSVRLMKQLARPRGLLRRLLWPLTPNPFRSATPREVGDLLGFFCVCLTLDGSVSSPTTTPPGMYRPRSPDSSRPSRRGPGGTATRAPGATS